MQRQRLYIVHGMGSDAVGLVGSITTPIAKAGGNIVDLRQDVLHGLFTIYMVVDLSESQLRIEAFTDMVKGISEDTGLQLMVDTYYPVARSPEKKNALLILLGNDKPGIIASISQTLSKYAINIECAQTIAREGVFLMELLTDISHCSLPLGNLKALLEEKMGGMGMKTILQTEDVFNKKKRVILFDIASSFMSKALIAEILRQTGISPSELSSAYCRDNAAAVLVKAASCLDGFPVEVMNTILGGISATPGTSELLQTLKIMGYRIGLVSNGFSLFTDSLKTVLGLDFSFGMQLDVDDDSKAVRGVGASDAYANKDLGAIIRRVTQTESVAAEDVTVMSDVGLDETCGIRLEFNLEMVLDLYNKHVISKENLVGLLGSFGVPRGE